MASLNDLYSSAEQLSDEAKNLFAAYENSDDVGDLKMRAVQVRDRAQSLVDAFDGVNEALGLL